MSHTVFVSYAAEDEHAAVRVCTALEAGGIQTWIACRDIRGGEQWPNVIPPAISSSRLIVLILSRSSNRSPQVPREIELADKAAIPVIPFRLEDVEPAGGLTFFLSSVQRIDAFPNWDAGLSSLVSTTHRRLGTAAGQPSDDRPRSVVEPPSKPAARKSWIVFASAAGLIVAALAGVAIASRWQQSGRVRMIVAPLSVVTADAGSDYKVAVSVAPQPGVDAMPAIEMAFDGQPFAIDCGTSEIAVTEPMREEIRKALPKWNGSSVTCRDFPARLTAGAWVQIRVRSYDKDIFCGNAVAGFPMREVIVIGRC